MIKIQFDNLWKYNKDGKIYFEPIKLKIMKPKRAWFNWLVDIIILNFEIEIWREHK